jgi:S-formylglutathione hydrolase
METLSETRAFGGVQGVYRHASTSCGCDMTFAVYMPPDAAAGAQVPCLWYLSGLTCTHENAMTKAGAQVWAAEAGMAIVFPDTSPRGAGIADDDAFDLGQGAGFYVDATRAPWAPHYAMDTYVTQELQALVLREFPVDPDRQGITGHSMGGHGALTLAMARQDLYRSLSVFAPIANPSMSDWGRKQLTAYLGADESRWGRHDATLMLASTGWPRDVLVDQGLADPFLDRLMPEALSQALAQQRVAHQVRLHGGYDHSYSFVASFMADHIAWHAERL